MKLTMKSRAHRIPPLNTMYIGSIIFEINIIIIELTRFAILINNNTLENNPPNFSCGIFSCRKVCVEY